MAAASPEATAVPAGYGPVEGRRDKLGRHAHRTRLYLTALVMIAALIYLVALIVANTTRVHVSWVFGSGRTSLVWLVVIPAILGWIVGVMTSMLYRRRTRRRV